MKKIHSSQDMQKYALELKAQGKRIGFVPTMGYLHEGHLSLIEIAKKHCEIVGASIFVNPTQFGPNEDFSKYPRDEKGDIQKLESVKTDFLFLPSAQDMYPEGFQTTVSLGEITKGLCGAHRPGHFDGVATVVLKLFNITQADVAVFGEKDYQQLAVIRKMVEDLNLAIEIIGAPTSRSSEGLALSSRNVYLNEEEKKQALTLYQSIQLVQKLYKSGEKDVKKIISEVKKLFLSFPCQIDYLEIVDKKSLKSLEIIDCPARYLVAVKIGKTRLIDNASVQ